jgi:hypothetical protein
LSVAAETALHGEGAIGDTGGLSLPKQESLRPMFEQAR